MALSDTTFNSAAGSVSDIFAGLGASTAASMIQAQGDVLQAEGNLTEATNYDLASDLATKNAEYTALSTAIQEQQQQRSTTMQIGGQRAAIAGAGFAESVRAWIFMPIVHEKVL